MRQLSKPRTLGLLATSAVLVIVTGCGGSGTSGGTSSGDHTGTSHESPSESGHQSSTGDTGTPAKPHSGADVTFAEAMVPLEARAAQMAGLAATQSSSAPVHALAQEIQRSREGQVKTLKSWLRAWGAPAPASGGSSPAGAASTGLPSDTDLAQLRRASGIPFDRLWLSLMISEQQAELGLARTVLKDGGHAEVQSLARDVTADRRISIERMRGLLQDRGD
jgi:uncharacterized protein (DUF305 family)